MIVVTGSVVAKPDTFDEMKKLAIEHVERSRKEPGCLSHDVHVDCQNPMRLFFFETWENEAAIEAHFRLPASRDTVKRLRELADQAGSPEVYKAERVM